MSSIACSAWSGGKLAGGDGMWGGIGGNFAKSGAGTLFFGVLAGGVGAKLGGGNFWQGAVTGLFVAGLNHAMHDSPNRRLVNKIRREMKTLNGNCTPSQANADKVKNLPTMKNLAGKSGNPSVNFIDMDVSSVGGDGMFTTNAEDVNPNNIGSATDFSKGSHINVYRDAFSDWNHLTEVVIHEYGHAYSRYNGIFQGFYNNNGLSKAYALDEVFAYQWQSCFGFSMFYPNSNIYISGLTQALNKL